MKDSQKYKTIGTFLVSVFLLGMLENVAGADELTDLKSEVDKLKKRLDEVTEAQDEWKEAKSVVHLAGYASVRFADVESGTSGFDKVKFNPIFHYQYADLILLEAELEVEVEEDGETEVALEYMTIDWLINDYTILLAGKFLSPIGQFRQNLHPDWINKLPSSPSGFDHDQAAPISDVGIQFRGGFPAGRAIKMNYAAYVSNGPIIELNAVEGEIEAIESEGSTGNADDEMVFGGRLGILPIPMLEFGVSAAAGDVGPEGEENILRDYEVFGADFAYKIGNFDLRAEFVSQKLGSNSASAAPESAKWEAAYAQAAYRFAPSKWEAVLRYSDYDSPHNSEDQKQWAAGVNYWFAENAVAKLAFESNDGEPGEVSDTDRWLLQFAYGF